MTTELHASRLAPLPLVVQEVLGVHPPSHPEQVLFDEMDLSQYAQSGMTSLVDLLSSSAGERSILCRHVDFAPPEGPLPLTPALPAKVHLLHHPSSSSVALFVMSTVMHESEAVHVE